MLTRSPQSCLVRSSDRLASTNLNQNRQRICSRKARQSIRFRLPVNKYRYRDSCLISFGLLYACRSRRKGDDIRRCCQGKAASDFLNFLLQSKLHIPELFDRGVADQIEFPYRCRRPDNRRSGFSVLDPCSTYGQASIAFCASLRNSCGSTNRLTGTLMTRRREG